MAPEKTRPPSEIEFGTEQNWAVDSGISSLESHYPERKLPAELIAEARTNLSAMGVSVERISVKNWEEAQSKTTPAPTPEQVPGGGMKI